MCVAARGHGSVALRAGRLCAGDEIQRVQHVVVCSDLRKCTFDLQLMPTAAAASLSSHFLQALLANASGALSWFMLGRTGKTQNLLMGSPKLSESPKPLWASRILSS